MTLFVDTSVWSHAFRRDSPKGPEVAYLSTVLELGNAVVTTGLVLQELLQGFRGPNARDEILERFEHLPLLPPDRDDHIDAADLRNECRRSGVQVGTINALLAQLCLRHDLTMLAIDQDFRHIARVVPLTVWGDQD